MIASLVASMAFALTIHSSPGLTIERGTAERTFWPEDRGQYNVAIRLIVHVHQTQEGWVTVKCVARNAADQVVDAEQDMSQGPRPGDYWVANVRMDYIPDMPTSVECHGDDH